MRHEHEMEAAKPPLVRELEGLRAIAVALVLVFHLFPTVLPGGYLGVDIFFVISGYFITQFWIRDLHPFGQKLVRFYSRRIRRIVPALLLVIAATLLVGAWVLTASEYLALGKAAQESILFRYNRTLLKEEGYFDTASTLKPLLHLWSLGVEGQWYVIWPLILGISLRLRQYTKPLLLVVMIASLAAGISMLERNSSAVFYLTTYRAWEFIAGALIALRPENHARMRYAPEIGLSLILLSQGMVFGGIPAWMPQLTAVAGAAFVLMGAGMKGMAQRLLASRPFVGTGQCSYALYLWHWPWISFASLIAQGPLTSAERWVLIPLIGGSAYLSWRWVELPARKAYGKRAWIALVSAWVLIGFVAYTVVAYRGMPSRYPEVEADTNHPLPREQDVSCTDRITKATGSAPRYCRMPDTGIPKIALVGDSHGNRLYDPLQAKLAEEGGLLFLGEGGCPPLYGARMYRTNGKEYCETAVRRMIDFIAQEKTIHTVLLTSRGPYYMYGTEFGDAWGYGRVALQYKRVSGAEAFQNGLNATIARLQNAGKQVVLILDNPEFAIHPMRCRDTRPGVRLRPVEDQCRYPRTAMEARTQEYRHAIHEMATHSPGLRVVNLLETFCDKRYCYGSDEGGLLYMDFDHLSQHGAEKAAKAILQTLKESQHE